MAFGHAEQEFGFVNKFVRVTDEGPLEVTLVGEENIAKVKWVAGVGFIVAEDNDPEGRPRGVVNVFVPSENRLAILQGPVSLFRELWATDKKCDIASSILTLTRTGQGTQTRYSARFLRRLTKDEQGALDAVSGDVEDLSSYWNSNKEDDSFNTGELS